MPAAAPAAHTQLVVPPSPGYVQAPSVRQASPPAMHAPVGCPVGHVGHVVQVHTGAMPPPQSQTTLPLYVHGPSPAVHMLWLFGDMVGHVDGFPPLLLPLPPPLLPLLPPLDPLLPPLEPPLPLEPLLPLEPPLPPEPLLPLLPSAPASDPELPALVLPPHPGATIAKPLTDKKTKPRILIALIEEPPAVPNPTGHSTCPTASVLVSSRLGAESTHLSPEREIDHLGPARSALTERPRSSPPPWCRPVRARRRGRPARASLPRPPQGSRSRPTGPRTRARSARPPSARTSST
jgi:hypothetical protein